MALHAGEIHPDAHGVTGSAVNRAFRLIEAPALKSALDDSAGVLALIVSDWFYDEVVRHEPAAGPGCYRHVHAVVKETRAAAWIRHPGGSRREGCRPGGLCDRRASTSARPWRRWRGRLKTGASLVAGPSSRRRASFRPARRDSWAATVNWPSSTPCCLRRADGGQDR